MIIVSRKVSWESLLKLHFQIKFNVIMQEDGVDKVCSVWAFSGLERLLWSLARPHQYSGKERIGCKRTASRN